MPIDKARAVEFVGATLKRIERLRSENPNSAAHVAFVQSVGLQLARIFGPESAISRNFTAITYHATGSFFASPLDYQRELARKTMGAYQAGLTRAEGVLLSAQELLEQPDTEEILRGSRARSGAAKVFVSHGKDSPALTRIERYLRALGLEPVLVVREASEGLGVDAIVDKRMDECDCAVIVATADDEVGDYRQPRPNVLHEIGLAQEKYSDRVIYLLEAGAQFPSNVRPKVWETFTQSDLSAAFEKIAKELRAFGYL